MQYEQYLDNAKTTIELDMQRLMLNASPKGHYMT